MRGKTGQRFETWAVGSATSSQRFSARSLALVLLGVNPFKQALNFQNDWRICVRQAFAPLVH